ncbi:MAG: aspartate aminotransferase family protein [Planctomycetaceae bacterium]|nr:aspartate aminotransferase family protein [Planctomycetaceae bacterium]
METRTHNVTESTKHLPLTFESFVNSYQKRTQLSKEHSEKVAPFLADKSSIVANRNELTRDLAYPIVVQRAKGSRVWDIDGNEYVDVLQGLGTNLFGHNPEFIQTAIADRLQAGFPIGVQTELAGQVAQQLVDVTGMPRVCFSNTGTEAIMTAIRVARAHTRRQKIVIFSNSYHGHTDSVLMRAPITEYVRRKVVNWLPKLRFNAPLLSLLNASQRGQAVPASPGIPKSVAKDVVVLQYGSDASLNWIKKKGRDIAAVLVEPVQSRSPELQPGEFLVALREATRECGALLIFDEMVTGFRIHPGGAQAYFKIDADLVTYSKIVGGGLPLSVIAGREAPMQYLGASKTIQSNRTVFFAGTFCKHPLSLVAAQAVLAKLILEGPDLQAKLNRRTETLVGQLNEQASSFNLPVRYTHFGSFFSIAVSESGLTPEDYAWLSYFLIHHGIFMRGGDRGGFLSTEHSDADLAAILQVFANGLEYLQRIRTTENDTKSKKAH